MGVELEVGGVGFSLDVEEHAGQLWQEKQGKKQIKINQ